MLLHTPRIAPSMNPFIFSVRERRPVGKGRALSESAGKNEIRQFRLQASLPLASMEQKVLHESGELKGARLVDSDIAVIVNVAASCRDKLDIPWQMHLDY